MASSQSKRVMDHLRRAVFAGEAADLSDGRLLTRFIEHRDEAAFEVLVRRHGPMVLGVCRRVLRTLADAEDAFQATFLVLVRKSASIQSRDTVANWLYGVAYNVALKARTLNARRGSRERQVAQMPEPEAVSQEAFGPDLQPLLDQELSRLPEKYRLPIVLCDLEGKSRKDAAQQLRLAEGTLSSRLTRARAKLARRLGRRGLVLPAAAVGAVLAQKAAPACVPMPLVSSTVQCAMALVAGPAAGCMISAPVAALTEGVLKAMLLRKLKLVLLGVLTAGLVFTGAAVSTQALPPEQATSGVEKAPPTAAQDGLPAPRTDRPREKPPPGTPVARESRVRTLLQERLKILRARADRLRLMQEQNAASAGEVRRADLRVLQAELELCETDRERIAVHEKIVGIYKAIEDRARVLQQQNAVSSEEIQDAILNRLEAEIALERVKEKVNAPSK
jgi:RNA polymerase sigma factor (sigma-70 family)